MAGGDEDDGEHPGADRGSYLAAGWELRITLRCLTNDLDLPATVDFDGACTRDIVRGFRNKRRLEKAGAEDIGANVGERTLRKLRYTHHHRGVTWWDEAHGVAWLCAYGYHERGADDDAYKIFDDLIERGIIYPTEADYAALRHDRKARLDEALPKGARELLAAARAAPATEIEGTLGAYATSVVFAYFDEEMQVLYVALTGASFDEMFSILAAFDTGGELSEWRPDTLPTRALHEDPVEVCWSIVYDPDQEFA